MPSKPITVDVAPATRGPDGVRGAERHEVVDGEEAVDAAVRAQQVGGGELRLPAVEVGRDAGHDLEAAAVAVPEAVCALAAPDVAGDPGDDRDPAARVDQLGHRVGAQLAAGSVVGADVGGDVDADGARRVLSDHGIDVHDRCVVGDAGERADEVGRVDRVDDVAARIGGGEPFQLRRLAGRVLKPGLRRGHLQPRVLAPRGRDQPVAHRDEVRVVQALDDRGEADVAEVDVRALAVAAARNHQRRERPREEGEPSSRADHR